ncbi:sensor histidine kinase [Algoriphagus sp.]|uniref:sensor histidine kinase n=1 Tax=Algoriphagus sp. TaxID=1872435 RepID=UPI0027174F2E|nr:ATP-binding protein [Algoriphagus sp.]MDO8967747.1 ATP-binding protein [Algoriphagus sp.]MDP3200031.1 ATP-binding protein [Algoriphagus sp.]
MILINVISLFLLFYLKKSSGTQEFPAQLKRYFNYGMIAAGVLIGIAIIDLPPQILFQLLSFVLVGGIVYLILLTPELESQKTMAITPLPIVGVELLKYLIETISPSIYNTLENYLNAAGFFALIWAVTMWLNHRKQMKEIEIERIFLKEQERQLKATAEQKSQLETLVAERTSEILKQKEELQDALDHLQSTQEQLIQQEKLASLGQLTAGIAHEIKNPLNFVNNFSELSVDFLEEIGEEMAKISDSKEKENILELLEDVKSNLVKIRHHGSRADSIVKSMLMHSRGGTGTMDPTDLNALIKEYSNLAFHGMRANPNPINVDIQLDLDESLPIIHLNAEDFSRVILNLVKNAFDAMRDKIGALGNDYKAKIQIQTKDQGDHILIKVEDNGPGVPDEIRDKLLMPFFTTKKGTEGTGLGLSITHDIIKSHEGKLTIESKVGEFTRFSILLPKVKLGEKST